MGLFRNIALVFLAGSGEKHAHGLCTQQRREACMWVVCVLENSSECLHWPIAIGNQD